MTLKAEIDNLRARIAELERAVYALKSAPSLNSMEDQLAEVIRSTVHLSPKEANRIIEEKFRRMTQ